MKVSLFFLFLLTSVFSYAQEEELHRCIEHNRTLSDTEKESVKNAERSFRSHVKNTNLRLEETIYKIPVVVHVVYSSDKNYVSVEQIKTQIAVLNQDYRRKNIDTSLTPSVFKDIAADAQIEFELARKDPQGNPTTGITFTKTTMVSFNYVDEDMKFTNKGGIDAWDPTRYLNIWVCTLTGGVLGYVPYPMVFGAKNDGVTVSYRAFGTIGELSPYFNKGRTVTHEVGHWLGLFHLWGSPDNVGCSSDGIDDTPQQPKETDYKPASCPVFPYIDSSPCANAPNGRMFSNFMDYTRDNCMNMFTIGQVDKMRATLVANRSSILNSDVIANPYQYDLAISEIRFDTASYCNGLLVAPKVTVINLGSKALNAFEIVLNFNGEVETKTVNSSLMPLQDSVFIFSPINGTNSNNELEVDLEVLSPSADEYLKNNSGKLSFLCSEQLSIYPNPAIDFLTIKGNKPKVVSATFYTLAGKEMFKIDNPAKIDVSTLVPGSYLVVFQTETNKIRQQFVVIH